MVLRVFFPLNCHLTAKTWCYQMIIYLFAAYEVEEMKKMQAERKEMVMKFIQVCL